MRSQFEYERSGDALLAPLGRRRRRPFDRIRGYYADLPPAAAPLAVTLGGGLVLLVVLGTFLGRQADAPPPDTAEVAAAAAETPEQRPRPAGAPSGREADAAASPPSSGSSAAPAGPAPARSDAAAPRERPARPDPGRTASIPRAMIGADAARPPVPVAETEEELLALEAIQSREVEADLSQPSQGSQPSQEATAAIAAPPAAPRRQAVTTRYVNMRAGPGDDADVMLVVPALAEIEAEEGCDWCAVTYDGRAGFIYRTFISYRD